MTGSASPSSSEQNPSSATSAGSAPTGAPRKGIVHLVGAGPGDPGLITARGLELLRQAEVLVFDALANPVLLQEAPAGAIRIDAGKRSRQHTLTQDQINQALLEHAQAGRKVVRLKGGDPYLFGRGAEEAVFLAHHGVTCEVVPGVTSGIAAPAAAGIPVTHRQIASTVTFVTGHEDASKTDSVIDYAALAQLIAAGGTVCFYMGVGNLEGISRRLQEHGLAATTAAALVQWGTTPRQKSVRTTLGSACADVAKAGISSPAIIIVGPVAAIEEPGLNYFTERPLFGRSIVITRTRQQSSELRSRLLELGALVLEAPTIELTAPPAEELARVDEALANIARYQWLILTSSNGVEAVAQRLAARGLDSRALAGVRIAAIGEATSDALWQQLRLKADFIPTQFVGESLAGEMISKQHVAGQEVLLLRADIARPALPRLLRQAGAKVTELTAYQTGLAGALPEEVLQALRAGSVDWVTFTSSSTAKNMVELLGEEGPLLKKVKIASIGPITSSALREVGLQPTIEAGQFHIAGLIDALIAAEKPKV